MCWFACWLWNIKKYHEEIISVQAQTSIFQQAVNYQKYCWKIVSHRPRTVSFYWLWNIWNIIEKLYQCRCALRLVLFIFSVHVYIRQLSVVASDQFPENLFEEGWYITALLLVRKSKEMTPFAVFFSCLTIFAIFMAQCTLISSYMAALCHQSSYLNGLFICGHNGTWEMKNERHDNIEVIVVYFVLRSIKCAK